MKTLFRTAPVLVALVGAATAAAQSAEDRSKVQALASRWEQAWNAHDMKALASLFTDDADFVNVGARHWKGRAEIESQHASRASQFAESILTNGETTVQFLTPDVALAHVTWGLKGDKNPDGTKRDPREGLLTLVAVRKDGDWLIRAAQNTNRRNPRPLPGAGRTAETLSPECSFGVRFQALAVGPITFRFPDQPIRKIFDVIEKISGTPIRVPTELDYRVTFDFRNLPPCRVLEIIGDSLSLTYRQEGTTIVVVAPALAPPRVAPPVPRQQ